MIKTLLFLTTLVSLSFCNTIVVDDIAGISAKKLANKHIVSYNFKTNELKKEFYYIKDAQLYKEILGVVKASNNLNGKKSRAFEYKTKLKTLGCISLKAKECIETSIDKKIYFKNINTKFYIVPKETSPIFEIIKYNY